MVLDDVEPEIFAMLSHWLHNRGRLPTFRNADDVAKGETLVKYAKLWILADRLIMPFLQNNTIDLFQQKIGEVGLDECEGLMDLLYGDRQNADGETGMLKKVLLYKFYVTRKEQLDSCKYTVPPIFQKELEQCTPRGWGEIWGTEPLWNKAGTPDYGRTNLANNSRKWREPTIGINVRVSEKVLPDRYNLPTHNQVQVSTQYKGCTYLR